MIRVDVIRAWPHRHEIVALVLPDASSVADALSAAGMDLETGGACAVFGVRVAPDEGLRNGDRIEVLRPLQLDPKDSRRRRAAGK